MTGVADSTLRPFGTSFRLELRSGALIVLDFGQVLPRLFDPLLEALDPVPVELNLSLPVPVFRDFPMTAPTLALSAAGGIRF
jgi:hypothetical protein